MANRAKKVIEVNVNENKTANKINTHMKMQARKGKQGKKKAKERGKADHRKSNEGRKINSRAIKLKAVNDVKKRIIQEEAKPVESFVEKKVQTMVTFLGK